MSRTMADRRESTRTDAGPVIPAAPERARGSRPAPVVVRRHAALSALIGLGASALSALYLIRAVEQDGTAAWVVGVALALLAMFHLTQWVDARTPLLVADATGVRLRLGNAWHGLLWDDVSRVTVRPRRGLFRDGRVVVHPRDEGAMQGLRGRSGRRLAANTRMYGAPFALPLGLTTVSSADDLAGALDALATSGTTVEVTEPTATATPDPEPEQTAEPAVEPPAGRSTEPAATSPTGPPAAQTDPVPDPFPEPVPSPEPQPRPEPVPGPQPQPGPEPQPTPEPAPAPQPEPAGAHETPPAAPASAAAPEPPQAVRPVRRALRSDVVRPPRVRAPIQGQLALQQPQRDDEDAATGATRPGDRSRGPRPRGNMSLVLGDTSAPPAPVEDTAVEPEPEPPVVAVIGPRITEARKVLRMSVDDLAARTRIRPHVIEAVEVDDFGPCAGDFYARGHLRALCRVLGIDPEPLLERFEELYASEPIDARTVFEAELAAGDAGAIRGVGSHGGPRWGGLVAAVLILVLVWALASVFLDEAGGTTTDGSDVPRGSAAVTVAGSPTTPGTTPGTAPATPAT